MKLSSGSRLQHSDKIEDHRLSLFMADVVITQIRYRVVIVVIDMEGGNMMYLNSCRFQIDGS